ncbi:MAG TPA: Ig domain-containing protein [Terriglobales bacterium]|nr:Ig domain-containing protein [Terriglobales bacterium]
MISRIKIILLTCIAGACVACGGGSNGGGGNGGGGLPTPQPQALTITTQSSSLPGALQGHSYIGRLTAANGVGALHWSISPEPGLAFTTGLLVDAGSGIISGTANFLAGGGFTAQVTDSASPPRSASANLVITAYAPLAPYSNLSSSVAEFAPLNFEALGLGGVPPLTYSLGTGNLPAGVRIDGATGSFVGGAQATGTFNFNVAIQDSYSPPEIVQEPILLTVTAPRFLLMDSLPQTISLNRPFSTHLIVQGGTPPYSFVATSGTLPVGLNPVDSQSGILAGTPTTAGTYNFTIMATDSSSPRQTYSQTFSVQVQAARGRNDSPATATFIDNGGNSVTYQGSISPYVDPPGGVANPDDDYYKVISFGGATVHAETMAKRLQQNNSLDTVIEIVDGNGVRLGTCRQPGDTSTTFTSSCINDDISANPHVQDSALDFQVPGPATSPTAFYIHVLDWRGDARPDMTYNLTISGFAAPLSVGTSSLLPIAEGVNRSQQLLEQHATGAVTWSVASGTLPPGITLSSSGMISGAATADGTFPFTVQVTDSSTPQQTASAPESIVVADPVRITSGNLTSACLNQPYTFTVQTTGGAQPLLWSFFGSGNFPVYLVSGVFSGTPTMTGTFDGTVAVTDGAAQSASQQVSLTVNQCP